MKRKLTFEEFKNICFNKGTIDVYQVLSRWKNYMLLWNSKCEGVTASDVGSNINKASLKNNLDFDLERNSAVKFATPLSCETLSSPDIY